MQVTFVIVAALCVASAVAISLEDVPVASVLNKGIFTEQETLSLFRQFQDVHGDVSPAEFDLRLTHFKATLVRVAKQNAAEGNTAVWGINKFAALSEEEFKANYLSTFNMADAPSFDDAPEMEPKSVEVPSAFTWENHSPSVVSPIKNQGQCGSCWAFSATENIESIWALAGNTLTVLAPQQIVDCDSEMQGCNGGWPVNAIQYVIKAGGQEPEADYPYKAVNGECKFEASKVVAKPTGWRYATTKKDESTMQANLVSWGPLSIAVDASTWQSYTGGVVSAASCGHQIDHGVGIVGYAPGYWIVRNSWGAGWGLSGFIHVELGKNACSIADMPVSAIVGTPSSTSSGNSGNSGHSGSSSGGSSTGGSSTGGSSTGSTGGSSTSSGYTSSSSYSS